MKSCAIWRSPTTICLKRFTWIFSKYIFLYIYTSYIHTHTQLYYWWSLSSTHFFVHGGHFGELGGMFCSLPLRLDPCWEEYLRLCCSWTFNPAPPNFAWALAPLKDCSGWREGRPTLSFCGLSVLHLEIVRSSSTLLTLSSCRGWTGDVEGREGEGACAGGESLASLWQTSA